MSKAEEKKAIVNLWLKENIESDLPDDRELSVYNNYAKIKVNHDQ